MEVIDVEKVKKEETDDDEDLEDYERYFEEYLLEESETEAEEEAICVQEEAILSWKTIILITFNEKWKTLILCSTMIYFFFIIYSAGFATPPISKVEIYLPLSIDILYTIDVFLIVMYKSWSQLNASCVFPVLSNYKLTLDTISIVPLDLAFFTYHGFGSTNNKELAFFRFNKLLRLFRFQNFFNNVHNTVSHINVTMHLFEWLTYFIIFNQISALFLYSRRCFDQEECWPVGFVRSNFTVFQWYLVSLYVVIPQIGVFARYPDVNLRFMEEQVFFFFVNIISFFILTGYLLGYLTSAFIHQKQDICIFFSNLKTTKMYMNFHRVHEKLKSKVINSTEQIWKKKGAVRHSELLSILPAVMIKQTSIDIFWPAFKHSHLFKNMDMSFLYNLAAVMKYSVCLPGDVIYQRNELKNKMVYIVSGVVQVLSEVNEETPIISFSAGTCLGESTLFASYRSSTNVVCSTYCELMVLERLALHLVLLEYPFQRKFLKQYIKDRYMRGQEYLHLSYAVKKFKNEDMKSLLWLKTILKQLNRGEEKSLLDENGLGNLAEFTPKYLDLYVMTEELELVTDPVCLKPTCPCILQPTSEVLHVWNFFVVCIAIIAAFMLPYYAFLACIPIKYKDNIYTGSECKEAKNGSIIRIITIIFFFTDLVIQLLTAVRTKDELVADWKRILLYRITEPAFITDILATIPLEFSTILIGDTNETEVLMCTFSLNRLLKLWKLESLFIRLENSMTLDMVIVRFIRYAVIMTFGVYYTAVLLYGVACYRGDCQYNSWFRFEMDDLIEYDPNVQIKKHIMISIVFATVIWTGKYYDKTDTVNIYDIVIIVLIMVITSFLLVFMVAGLSATKILKLSARDEFQEAITRFKKLVREHKMNTYLQHHILMVLETKWKYIHSISTINVLNIIRYTNSELREKVQTDICFRSLCHVPLFQECSSEFVRKVAARAEILVTPPKMTVFYTGEVAKEMYVIINGYCEVMSNLTGRQQKVLGPNDHFGAVEIFLNIPCATTVCTITNCRLVTIKETHLRRMTAEFPTIHMNIKEVVSSCSKLQQISKFHFKQFAFDAIMTTSYHKTTSFHSFGMSSKKTEYEEPFKNMGYLSLIRYLSLPVTIMPDGRFIKWWEGFRLFFAFVSCLWFPARIIALSYSSKWTSLIDNLLDITAYLDIYVRMHVCYYNEDGILVTHPIKTATYYLKHGFLLDFIGCIPVEVLKLTQKTQQYSYFQLIRVVQAHRIFSFFRYLDNNIIRKRQFMTLVKYLPFYIIVINLCASCMCTLACRFDETIPADEHLVYEHGVLCENESWMHLSEFANHLKGTSVLHPHDVYIYGIYLMTSIICPCVFRGIRCETETEIRIFLVLSLTAFMIYLGVVSSIVASCASHNMDLTFYQEQMFELVNYINSPKISSDLRSDSIKYFEMLWTKKQGQDIVKMLQIFHFTLREDILITIYGNTLKECAVLTKAGASFCRVLLENMNTKFILKHGIVINLNDICDEIYIIHKGRIEVIASNGSKLITLHRGGMFGNFELQSATRQTLTMQARSHVEILIIKTATLKDIFKNYPHLRDHFNQIVQMNRDFVAPTLQTSLKTDEEIVTSETSSQASLRRSSKSSIVSVVTGIGTKVYSPSNIYIKSWELNILMTGALVNYVTLLYQAVLQEHSLYLWTVQYVIDVTYIIKIFLTFHLAFEDEFGDVIVDRKRIASKYIKDPYGLYLDILTTVPLEVFAFAVGRFKTEKFFRAYSYFHLNRLPRIVFLIRYFYLNTNKLNINVLKRRFMYILLIVVLYFHTISCLHIYFKDISTEDWNLLNLSYHERLLEYAENLWIATALFFGNSFDEDLAFFPTYVVFYVFGSILSQLIQYFIVGEMCAVIEIAGYTKINYANKISSLKAYLRLQALSPVLLKQAWNYMLSLWDHYGGKQVPTLLTRAPVYLVEAVKTSLYGQLIHTNYIFCNCQSDFLRQIIQCLKVYNFFPGNYIAFQSEVNDNMYFIYSGEVEVLSEGEDYYCPNREDILKAGDVFGMIQGLYPQRMHKYSYRAQTITEVVILQRQDWHYLLRFFPESEQEIYQRATDLQFTF